MEKQTVEHVQSALRRANVFRVCVEWGYFSVWSKVEVTRSNVWWMNAEDVSQIFASCTCCALKKTSQSKGNWRTKSGPAFLISLLTIFWLNYKADSGLSEIDGSKMGLWCRRRDENNDESTNQREHLNYTLLSLTSMRKRTSRMFIDNLLRRHSAIWFFPSPSSSISKIGPFINLSLPYPKQKVWRSSTKKLLAEIE